MERLEHQVYVNFVVKLMGRIHLGLWKGNITLLYFFAPWVGFSNRGDHSKFSDRIPSELELSGKAQGCILHSTSFCIPPAISAVCHLPTGISSLKAFLHATYIVCWQLCGDAGLAGDGVRTDVPFLPDVVWLRGRLLQGPWCWLLFVWASLALVIVTMADPGIVYLRSWTQSSLSQYDTKTLLASLQPLVSYMDSLVV